MALATMTLTIRSLRGHALDAALDDVARLRIEVFRDFPYLYDGDAEYEHKYLESYRNSPRAILVGAFDGNRLVGASTGTPLANHDAAFIAPVENAGLEVERTFYCAESVLLAEFRGQGAGHAFFDVREAHARDHGFTHSAFCSVIRPEDHPERPRNYRPLDPFWRDRGYAPLEGAIARFDWREVGEPVETTHSLQFWSRHL